MYQRNPIKKSIEENAAICYNISVYAVFSERRTKMSNQENASSNNVTKNTANNGKRRDDKGRILRTGESQRKGDGRYVYKYTDLNGKVRRLYARRRSRQTRYRRAGRNSRLFVSWRLRSCRTV